MNLPAKISAVWFEKKERIFSTAIGTICSVFGVIISYIGQDILLLHNDKILEYSQRIDIYSTTPSYICPFVEYDDQVNFYKNKVRDIM